jgi:hypothetical protein
MFAITDLDDIEYFADEPKIISIFLASRLEKSTIDWLFYGWLDLNIATGHAWHLLVPTINRIGGRFEKATGANFNSILSAKLMERYSIDRSDAPCIVFDDLNEEHAQHYVSLKGKTEIELRDFIYKSAEIIKRNEESSGSMSPGLWRSKVIGEIYNLSQIQKYGRGLMRLTPLVGSLTKFLAGHPH